MKRGLVIGLVCVAVSLGLTFGGELKKGENEATFRFSYANIDMGSSGGLDVGSQENTDVHVAWGYLLTDTSEVGVSFGYIKQDFSGSDIFESETTDGTTFGVFYDYNFKTKGQVLPYVGVGVSTIGGDLGDLYDLEFGVEAGIKFYPFDHAGVNVGVSYSKLQGAESGIPDGDGIALGAGLLIKF